jgi:hypothetical protein
LDDPQRNAGASSGAIIAAAREKFQFLLPDAWGRITMDHATEKEAVMAKGQMRVPKEKKKPKADKDKPKQLSAYKLSQMQGSAGGSPYSSPPGKKP